ncbi:hypothetical protein ACF063_39320 [Streptomyces chartreusis]|uniref:hypothetical protein n=1 Tax=Streptomyces chartreusis TaxID=1969 RepID=UPI0036FE7656
MEALARDVLEGAGQATSDVNFYVVGAGRFDGPGEFEADRVNTALLELSDLLRKFTEKARDALDAQKV